MGAVDLPSFMEDWLFPHTVWRHWASRPHRRAQPCCEASPRWLIVKPGSPTTSFYVSARLVMSSLYLNRHQSLSLNLNTEGIAYIMKPPLERTHDVSSVNYHVRDLKTFGQTLTSATAAAFPNAFLNNPDERSRYDQVHVLLLHWEEDLLGVSAEVAELRDVSLNIYHYDTEEWHIPRNRSHNSLVMKYPTYTSSAAACPSCGTPCVTCRITIF